MVGDGLGSKVGRFFTSGGGAGATGGDCAATATREAAGAISALEVESDGADSGSTKAPESETGPLELKSEQRGRRTFCHSPKYLFLWVLCLAQPWESPESAPSRTNGSSSVPEASAGR